MTGAIRPAGRATFLCMLVATMLLVLGCGGSAGSPASSAPGAAATDEPAATQAEAPAASDAGGPIGGDIGDRSKGSVQAQITGDLTAPVDLPFAPDAARFELDGPQTAYLPFTDTTNGTLFLTITDAGLLIQYAGPDQVGLTNGSQPCDVHLDSLDGNGANGSFTCKGLLLIKPDAMGSADITGTFEGHK